MILSTVNFKKYSEESQHNYPEKHILAGLPLFTAPIQIEKREEKTVHMSSINDIIFSRSSMKGRQLVFAGKVVKKAGDRSPFSMVQLIETKQAGLV